MNSKIISTITFLTLIWHAGAQTLDFSGYIGASGFESMRDVTTDQQGNIYITGGTTSPDFPVTDGAFQVIHNPGTPDNTAISTFDVFITKFDPTGAIIWSTFLGGPNYDRAYGIEVDSAGFVYVAGRAGNGFPVTTNAFQTAFQGGEEAAFYGPQDGFVVKLSPDGSTLIWSSYFGTSDARIIRDIAVDKNGNVYLASGYSSGSYVAAVHDQFVNTPRGNHDAVLAKVAPNGQSITWARYLGGTSWDSNENSVRIGQEDDPYALFTTESSSIATPGAYDGTYGGNQDFFITRIEKESGNIIWGTYLGGSENESTETHEFAVDINGNAYVSGPTKSVDYPVTPGAFQSNFIGPAGFNDIVVSKIAAAGNELLASTYIGGNGADRTEGIDVDTAERVFITGTTTSTNFPLTPDAYQSSINGPRDAFAIIVSADFGSLDYSTYMGSSGSDYGRCADVDHESNFIIGGDATTTGWPVAGNGEPFQGGTGDAIIAKFSSGITTAIPDLKNEKSVHVFPNPGEQETTIDLQNVNQQVRVIVSNAIGQLIDIRHNENVERIYLDTSAYGSGVYFLSVQNDHVTSVIKWIKI